MKKIWRKIRNYIKALLAVQGIDRQGADDSSTPAVSDKVPSGGTGFSAVTADDVEFPLLRWQFGGFKGGGATLSDHAIIKDLKMTRSGLSYSWEAGGCEDLGASGPHDAACLACLFCHVRDQWLGGKFDWISTDRRTRGLENIESGYGGWEYEAFRDADAYAFVIVSKDGRLRTNVIVQHGRN